jgi:hypothetical protein
MRGNICTSCWLWLRAEFGPADVQSLVQKIVSVCRRTLIDHAILQDVRARAKFRDLIRWDIPQRYMTRNVHYFCDKVK